MAHDLTFTRLLRLAMLRPRQGAGALFLREVRDCLCGRRSSGRGVLLRKALRFCESLRASCMDTL